MKRFGFIGLLTLASVFAFSQNTTGRTTTAGPGRVQFGIKGGVNLANLKYDNPSIQTESRTGFHVGALAHIHLAPNWALQPEVTYSGQGAEYTAPVMGEDDIQYVNIPVQLQYMFANGLRLQTGPQLGINTSAEFEPANGGPDSPVPNVNNLDFSWSVGAGYLSRVGLGLDVRYNHGISNVYEIANTEVKNRVWQLGVFYQFNR